jgi:O-antigen/teichoic acid export membrane protein
VDKFTKRQTKKNVVFAASQIVISGVTLFILYKYLLSVLGIELIGVWSIVMAFSAFLRTGDFGFAGSIVKFISTSMAQNDLDKVKRIIKTSFTSVSVILAALLLIFFPIIYYALPHFMDDKYIALAIELLPYSIISVWLAVLGTLMVFVFDGLNRVDIRSTFLVIFNILLVVLTIIFVNFYGFIGLGYAQVTQALLQLIAAWFLVRKNLNIDSILPLSWDKKLFKEMFSYSIHLQLSSLMSMMLEPISKLLLGYFGTMSSVGYFEMANRLVMQIRNVVVNANQALVPMLSKSHTNNEDLTISYLKTLKVLFVVSLVGYSFVAFLTPFVSEIWVGSYEKDFIYFTYIILFSLGINTLAGAAYFTNMATGDVRFNTQSQIVIAVLNIVLGIILGYYFTNYGVVVSYGLSIIIGSLWLIINFHIRNKTIQRKSENA